MPRERGNEGENLSTHRLQMMCTASVTPSPSPTLPSSSCTSSIASPLPPLVPQLSLASVPRGSHASTSSTVTSHGTLSMRTTGQSMLARQATGGMMMDEVRRLSAGLEAVEKRSCVNAIDSVAVLRWARGRPCWSCGAEPSPRGAPLMRIVGDAVRGALLGRLRRARGDSSDSSEPTSLYSSATVPADDIDVANEVRCALIGDEKTVARAAATTELRRRLRRISMLSTPSPVRTSTGATTDWRRSIWPAASVSRKAVTRPLPDSAAGTVAAKLRTADAQAKHVVGRGGLCAAALTSALMQTGHRAWPQGVCARGRSCVRSGAGGEERERERDARG